MKKLILIAAAAFAAWACEKSGSVECEAAGGPVTVEVRTSFDRADLDTDTEIIPMSRAKGQEIIFQLSNTYLCIITKETKGKWVVDRILNPLFQESRGDNKWGNIAPFYKGEVSDPLELELTPGKYRMLMIFNTNRGATNPDLFEGMVIDENDPPFALTYIIPEPDPGRADNSWMNAGHHVLYGEIFTAFKEFEISKTDSLSSGEYPRNFDLTAKRRVAKFRVMAKSNQPSNLPPNVSFAMFYTLVATDESKPFCQGIDVWNRPWYDKKEKLTTIDVVQQYPCRNIDINGIRYEVPHDPNATSYNPYYFVDPAEPTPIRFAEFTMNYQSGSPSFYCSGTIDRVLINNDITGVVVQELPDFDENIYGWWMQIVPEEDPKTLLPDNFEFNLTK